MNPSLVNAGFFVIEHRRWRREPNKDISARHGVPLRAIRVTPPSVTVTDRVTDEFANSLGKTRMLQMLQICGNVPLPLPFLPNLSPDSHCIRPRHSPNTF